MMANTVGSTATPACTIISALRTSMKKNSLVMNVVSQTARRNQAIWPRMKTHKRPPKPLLILGEVSTGGLVRA